MRTLDPLILEETVAGLLTEACLILPSDLKKALEEAKSKAPDGSRAKEVLSLICENAKIAEEEKLPICQDTGTPVVFLEWGAEVALANGTIQEAVDNGVRRAAKEAFLRRSLVKDPLERVNTGDNTPAALTILPVAGDKVKVMVLPKGAGCENMSQLKMLRPADGKEGVKDFILKTVFESGGNACPPLTVGIGLGGDASKAPLLAKKALFRPLGTRHPNPLYAALELELKEALNKEGQGPLGLGGAPTVLDVFIESAPCHIASLPVAISLNCHAARRAVKEI